MFVTNLIITHYYFCLRLESWYEDFG